MSVYNTVSAVVKTWANLQTPPSPSDRLEVLWSSQDAPFYPDGCRDLMRGIYAAFPGAANLKSNVKYQQIKDTQANATGNIDCVDDLSDAVAESLTAREVVFLSQAIRSAVLPLAPPPSPAKKRSAVAKTSPAARKRVSR